MAATNALRSAVPVKRFSSSVSTGPRGHRMSSWRREITRRGAPVIGTTELLMVYLLRMSVLSLSFPFGFTWNIGDIYLSGPHFPAFDPILHPGGSKLREFGMQSGHDQLYLLRGHLLDEPS